MRRKVTVLGLDGGNISLIKKWADSGELPNFKVLFDYGCYAPLHSTVPWGTVPAWPTFMTGVDPDKHGLYDFIERKNDSYKPKVITNPSRKIKKPTIWEIIGEYGLKSCVVNVPCTFPPKKIRGYLLSGMFTTSKNYCYPPELKLELKRVIGGYKIYFEYPSSKEVEVVLKDLISTLDNKMRCFFYLRSKDDFDFSMVVDNGTDRVQHEFWRFLDKENPMYDPDEVKKYGNPILSYLKYVDKWVGEFLNELDENEILILMSDHGSRPIRRFVNLNGWLINEGFIKIKRNPISLIRYYLGRLGFNPANIYKIASFFKKERVARIKFKSQSESKLKKVVELLFFTDKDIDWKRTSAYTFGREGININLRNREPLGIVPQSEYDTILNQIKERVKNFVDPLNGVKVVSEVIEKKDISNMDNAQVPDLLFIPSDYYEFFGAVSFPFVEPIHDAFGISGAHDRYGLFLAYGDRIKKNYQVKNINIKDLAPTILYLLNVPVPPYMDGKIRKDILA